jgi:hypothetical protein
MNGFSLDGLFCLGSNDCGFNSLISTTGKSRYTTAVPSSSTSTVKERELSLVVVQLEDKIANLESKHQKQLDHFERCSKC